MKTDDYRAIVEQILSVFNIALSFDIAKTWIESRNVTVRLGGQYDCLMHLAYSQIGDPYDPIANVCRGLVLVRDDNDNGKWGKACATYDRFFDIAMGSADKLDPETRWAEDKLDGSLIQLWFNDIGYAQNPNDVLDYGWITSTTGSLFGQGETPASETYGLSQTFSDLFWAVLGFDKKSLDLDTSYCYAFELCTPQNQIVLSYDKPKVILHSARHFLDFSLLSQERLIQIAENLGCGVVQRVPFDWDNLDAMRLLKDTEGFVLKDADGRKVKVKTQWYIDLHHTVSNGPQAEAAIKKLIWTEQDSEVAEIIAMKPVFEPIAKASAETKLRLTKELTRQWLYLNNGSDALPDIKSKAIAISNMPKSGAFKSLMYLMLNGKSDTSGGAIAKFADYPKTTKSKIEALENWERY